MLPRTIYIALLIVLFSLTCIGCSNSTPIALGRSLQEYKQGQWSISAMWARKALDEKQVHDEAAYMLGLCEFQMQHVENAKSWFEEATTSRDEELQGRAFAMLGIIASNEGDYLTAATSFEQAATLLEGRDRTRARSWVAAIQNGTSFTFTNSENPAPYTLQFGAYQKLENAQEAAKQLGSDLRFAGLGSASIVEEKNQVGKVLFMVRAGAFDSRTAASRCRKRHSLPQCIVTTVQ